jgi:hypothetical protein
MRSIPDRRLTEPYRSWIDRSKALPPDVVLIPRAIDARFDLINFVLFSLLFGGMGVLMLTLLPVGL